MPQKFLRTLNENLHRLKINKDIAESANADKEIINIYSNILSHFEIIKQNIEELKYSVNYIQLFSNIFKTIIDSLPYRNYGGNHVSQYNKEEIKEKINNSTKTFQRLEETLIFNFNFFEKLGFFKNNIVIIGANGSGKTSLAMHLKKYLPSNGVVISAQKLLVIPTFRNISNSVSTKALLQSSQSADKTLKETYNTGEEHTLRGLLALLGKDFQILLDNLLAERNAERNEFIESIKNNNETKNIEVPYTKFDKVLSIWNSIIEHRIISCRDGINIMVNDKSETYSAYKMSDGEKVLLYLTAHVLQAPTSGFIIIDEPEMYLHKTVLNKLWNALEKERPDCIFIYLTHDLDFATSRISSKKVWIRDYIHPDTWEIENISHDKLPESLLMELLGSRKNILFCEGTNDSLDEKIFNLLFPELTITPVESCFAVINYTKSFNKIPNLNIKAYGIIDSDHHDKQRLEKLKEEKIYSYSMSEIENLLLDENFLLIVAKQFLKDDILNEIKEDIIQELNSNKHQQAANYISSKINYYFKDSHMSKGNSLDHVKINYEDFKSKIDIDNWYTERIQLIKKLIKEKDYQKILSIYNNKGLKRLAEKHLKISDFTDRALIILQRDISTHKYLLKHFPSELSNTNSNTDL